MADFGRSLRDRHDRLRDPRVSGDLLRKILSGRQRQARVGVHYHRRDRQHPLHGRLHVDHEEVLQDSALPLVTVGHLRVERDHVSDGEAQRHCGRFCSVFSHQLHR